MKIFEMVILLILGAMLLIFVGAGAKAIMWLIMPESVPKGQKKYKYCDKGTNVICKIILHAIIIGGFVVVFKYPPTDFFEELLCIGTAWALVRICFSISIWDTFGDLFWFNAGAFGAVLIIKIICLFGNSYSEEMSMGIALLGLTTAFVCSFISEGHYLSLKFNPDPIYAFGETDPEPEKKKKGPSWDVTTIHNSDGSTSLASTYSDNGYSMTTIHHDNGKTTKIDESTIGGVRSIRVDKD